MDDQWAYDDHGAHTPVSQHVAFPHDELDQKLNKEIEGEVQRRTKHEVAQAVWEGVTRFAVEVLQRENPRLTVQSFAFAAGLYVLEGKSETEIAKEHGITRAAVSRRVVEITKSLGLPPSRGMKSAQSRTKYRNARLNYCASQLADL